MTVLNNPDNPCPPEILSRQVTLTVPFIDFDGNRREGTIEIDKEVAADVADFFSLALKLKFPIEQVLPSSHPDYKWDDVKLMADNISSGFNYRLIAGTDKISWHAHGRAFDINTRINPCIRYEKDQILVNGKVVTQSADSFWDKSKPGALHGDHPLVKLMEGKGWEWGGRWTAEKEGMVDYQHFQKRIGD